MRQADVDIIIDNAPEFYTNGDIVRGRLVLMAKKPKELRSLSASLKCIEIVTLKVSKDGKSNKHKTNSRDLFSVTHKVFPTNEMVAHRIQDFKLQKGEHLFDFEFEIPPESRSLPPTSKIDAYNGILWCIEAELETKKGLIKSKRGNKKLFEVQTTTPLPPINTTQLDVVYDEHSLTVFGPGFENWQKSSLSSMLKSMVPGNAKYRMKTIAIFRGTVPKGGICQGDHALNVDFDFDFSNKDVEDKLLIRKFEMSLKQKSVLTVTKKDKSEDQETLKQEFSLLGLPHVAWEFEEGLQQLKDMAQQVRITDRLPQSREGKPIDLQYKLAITIGIASKEKSDSIELFRVSIPVFLHRFVAYENATREPVLRSSEPDSKLMSKLLSESYSDPRSGSLSESMSEPVSEPTSEPVSRHPSGSSSQNTRALSVPRRPVPRSKGDEASGQSEDHEQPPAYED